MVEDYMLDMEDSSGPMWQQAWRCMNCGNVFDSVLQHNRQTQGVKLRSTTPGTLVGNDEKVPIGAEAMTRLAA
jgi:hypothetical protein